MVSFNAVVVAMSSLFVHIPEGAIYNCSDIFHKVEVNDTTPIGHVMVTATGNITQYNGCGNFLELSNGELVLKSKLTTLCADELPLCRFDTSDCSKTNILLLLTIVRTAYYNISYKEENYKVSIKENTKNATLLQIGSDKLGVNLAIGNCYNGDETSWERQKSFALKTESVPFFWSASRNRNSLYTYGNIDYEKRTEYALTIEGTYVGINGSATTTIFVEIIDEDDQNPTFNITDGIDYRLDIAEGDNATVNRPYTTTPVISAYDPDFGINATIKYKLRTITPSAGAYLFTIDPDKGTVNVAEVLDYETQSNYRLIIEAYQVDNPQSRTAQATINVNVIDIDDHKPFFRPDVDEVVLLEHSAVGTHVYNVKALDTDAGENGFITYRIIGKTEAFELLRIDNISAALNVKDPAKIDRENQENITVIIEPLTHHGEAGQNNLTVNIRLEDINDNNPVFGIPDLSEFSFTYVNQSAGTSIGKVEATDKDTGDNALLYYEIVNGTMNAGNCNNESPFILNKTTGVIVMSRSNLPCDGYRFVVQACDNPNNPIARRCSITTVAVARIANATVDNPRQDINVTESVTINTYVAQLMCGGTGLTYKVIPNIAAVPFGVSPSGILKTTGVLDRENISTYEFLVQVYQYGQVKCNFNISINILDVNDNAPEFHPDTYILYVGNPTEKGLIVGRVRANDSDIGDNGFVNYSFKTKSGQSYLINGSSGEISLVSPDHVRDIEQLVVIAADQGTPRYEASAVVYVLSGDAGTSSVPLNTPLQKGQITNKKESFERGLSEILNQSVVISHVDAYEKSPHRSRIFIIATEKSVETSTLVRLVYNNYEEIRTLFFSALETADTKSSHSDLGAPEIGLIVMAVVILVGTIIAIVFINRQFNSHKRYKKLYETLTKDSSMYESQEVNATMESESGSASTNEQAVIRENLLFSGDDNNIASESSYNVGETRVEESTSVKEAMDSLDQSLYSEENERQTVVNSEDLTDEAIESNQETPGSSDNVIYANVKMNKTESDGSNSLGNTDTLSNFKAQDVMIEEPNPDYDRKEVRFSAEVLDADENKMTPLKVKDETNSIGEGDDKSNIKSVEEGEDVKNKQTIEGDERESDKMHNDYNPTKDVNEGANENLIIGHLLSPDTDVEVDEIVSPSHDINSDNNSQVDFYFASEVSTHF
ncbi:protocadherin Fat 3-like [Dreissena polymorpha]|uniref:protocadherin Fat 3-like n=1 Tax=Dreissena polymorpha TaxID=45954 RepID=UPI0022641AE1|nr:protocadherin Fat 3-like [Dreissena polymorpha]